MKEVNTLLIKAILKIPLENQEEELSAQQYLNIMKKYLQFFHPLISNYIKSAESQLDCLTSVEVIIILSLFILVFMYICIVLNAVLSF